MAEDFNPQEFEKFKAEFDPNEFESFKSGDPQKPPPSWFESNVAPYMPRAVSDIPNAVYEATKNALTGAYEGLYANPMRRIEQRYQTDQTIPERMFQGVKDVGSDVKDITGGLLSAASVPIAPAVGAVTPPIADPYSRLTGIPYEQSKEAVQTALGAIGGRGITPMGPRAPVAPAPPGRGPLRDELRLLTQGGRELRAGQILEGAASDPAALQEKIAAASEIVPGSQPTTFQATGDMGLGALERGVQTKYPQDFMQRRAEQNSARLAELEKTQAIGSPEAVADHFRAQLRAADADSENLLKTAEFNAWQRANELGGAADPQIYGNIIRQELRTAEDAARAHERELWKAIDPEGKMIAGTGYVKDTYSDVYGNLTSAARAGLTDGEKRIGDVINGYVPPVPFKELTDLRSLVTKEMREELSTKGSTPAYARLVQLRQGIEESITNSVLDKTTGTFSREAADRLAMASAATRQRAGLFNVRPIRDILRREGLQGPYLLPEGGVTSKFFAARPIQTAYDNINAFRNAVGDRQAIPVLQDAAVESMRREAMTSDGAIDPKKLTNWMNKNQDGLRAIDEASGGAFSQRMRDAGAAQEEVARAAEVRQRVLDEHNQGVFGKLAQAVDKEDISNIIGRVFGRESAVREARALAARVRNNPDALDGARRAIVDYIQNRFISNTEAATSGENLIRSDQFQQFMKTKQAALREFFTPDQIDGMVRIADDLNRANRSISAVKIPGGSNTAQDFMALESNFLRANPRIKAMAALLSAAIGTKMAGLIGTAVGAVAGPLAVAMREAGIRSVQGLIKEAMLNPAKMEDLLKLARPLPKPVKGMNPLLQKYLTGASMFSLSPRNKGE